MPEKQHDVLTVDTVVIGAGTAGLGAYRAAVKAGRRVLLIEGGKGGTTCASVGCMPSKLLIAAAEAAHAVQPERTAPFGVHVENVRIDGHAVMDRVRRERDRFVGFVLEGMDAIAPSDKMQGWARFVDSNTLEVLHLDGSKTKVVFQTAVIATGSKVSYPEEWASLGDTLVVNDDVFSWTTLPKSVAVFGPGVVGLELGQALHRLGVHVHVFGRGNRLGPLSDPAVRDATQEALANEYPLLLNAQIKRVQRGDDGYVHVTYLHCDGAWHTERFEYLLAATGRVPNIESLQLSALGVFIDAQGRADVNHDTLALTQAPHVFMAGDVNGLRPLLHEAADDGPIAGKNAALYPQPPTPSSRRAPLSIVFSDPQMVVVGPGYSKLAPNTFVVGQVNFGNQGRARVMLRNRGLLRVYMNYTPPN